MAETTSATTSATQATDSETLTHVVELQDDTLKISQHLEQFKCLFVFYSAAAR